MSNKILYSFMLSIVVISGVSLSHAVQFGVFLDEWQLVGPFKGEYDIQKNLSTEYSENEASLNPTVPVEYNGETFEWVSYNHPIVEMQTAFDWSDLTSGQAAYAYTELQNDQEQKVTLAISADDGCKVWLNGEEVLSSHDQQNNLIDLNKVNVTLIEGTNTLVIKIVNRTGDWGTLVRFLPPDSTEPSVILEWKRDNYSGFIQPPVLDIEVLNDGETVQTLLTSGYSNPNPESIQFPLYGFDRSKVDQIRVRSNSAGYAELDQLVTLPNDIDAVISLNIEPVFSFEGTIVDEETGDPIENVKFWYAYDLQDYTSDENGKFSVSNVEPGLCKVFIYAEGYKNKQVTFPIKSEPYTIQMTPGGHTLKGIVKNEDGEGIPQAWVYINGREPISRTMTNDKGEYVLPGIDDSRSSAFPVIEHEDYESKDGFSQPLQEGSITEVSYTLTKGAIVTGTVIDKVSGKPIEGVKIKSGASRMASNRKVPETVTAADGTYTLKQVESGRALIHAFSDDYAPQTVQTDTSVDTPSEMNFSLIAGKDVTGTVTDPEGNPIHDVWLITDTWNGARMFDRQTRTKEDGTYVLRNMPDTTAEVHVMKQDYVSKRDLMVVGGQEHNIVLQPVVKHEIKVRLSGSEDIPQDVEVQKGYQWQGRPEISWMSERLNERNWESDTATLIVNLDENADAAIYFRFRVNGYSDGEIKVPRDANESQLITVTLEKTSLLSGTVVWAESGEPAENVYVAIVSPSEKLRKDQYSYYADSMREPLGRFSGFHSVTDSDGIFSLPNSAFNDQTDIVMIHKNGGFAYIKDDESIINQNEIVLPYPKASTITGTVTNNDKPSVNEQIGLRWKAGERSYDLPFGFGGSVFTDEEGVYEFKGVGAGYYEIYPVRSFESPRGGGISMFLTPYPVAVESGQIQVLDINREKGFSIKGVTKDRDGNPMSHCIVTIQSQMVGGNNRIEIVESDGNGEYSTENIPAGNYTIEVEHHARQETATCGIGDVDFRTQVTVTVNKDTTKDVVMQPFSQNAQGMAMPVVQDMSKLKAPDFEAELFDSDETVSLTGLKGKIVAIDFWATWCGPCLPVMPSIQKMHEEFKDRDDITIITVSLDQDENALRNFLKENKYTFPVIFNGNGWTDGIAQKFGVNSIPSSFVIGKNGKFTSGKVHGTQLEAEIQKALQMKFDDEDDGPVSTLDVNVAMNDGAGLPGTIVNFVLRDNQSNIIKEEDMPLIGTSTSISWEYPSSHAGGEITVSVEPNGMEKQSKSIKDLSDSSRVKFEFEYPITIRGKTTLDDHPEAIADVGVMLHGQNATPRSATTSADGSFELKTLPGMYYLIALGSEDYASSIEPQQISVTAEDKEMEVVLPFYTATTIRGKVIDENGAPVEGAMVGSNQKNMFTTQKDGLFEIGGIAANGPSRVFASKQGADGKPLIGQLQLDQADSNEEYTITMGDPQSFRPGQTSSVGQKIMDIELIHLQDGEPVTWSPQNGKDSLVVVCAFWHPTSKQLLQDAMQKAKEEDLHFVPVSIDWNQSIAKRELQKFPDLDEVYYAGFTGLDKDIWSHENVAQSYIISNEGKLKSKAVLDQLPN